MNKASAVISSHALSIGIKPTTLVELELTLNAHYVMRSVIIIIIIIIINVTLTLHKCSSEPATKI